MDVSPSLGVRSHFYQPSRWVDIFYPSELLSSPPMITAIASGFLFGVSAIVQKSVFAGLGTLTGLVLGIYLSDICINAVMYFTKSKA